MKKPDLNEQREEIRANIFADAVVRAVRWLAWCAMLAGLVLPLTLAAWREAGALAACMVLALCLALSWGVKPHGRSYGRQVRDIEARYPHE